MAAFILKYRVMHTGDTDASHSAKMAERRKTVIPLAIADGQQAVRLVRLHAPKWSIARDRIGILGFSAGGYVAAAVERFTTMRTAGPILPHPSILARLTMSRLPPMPHLSSSSTPMTTRS